MRFASMETAIRQPSALQSCLAEFLQILGLVGMSPGIIRRTIRSREHLETTAVKMPEQMRDPAQFGCETN